MILEKNYSNSLNLTLDAIGVGLKSVNPVRLMKKSVKLNNNNLSIFSYNGEKLVLDYHSFNSIYLIGAGKATASMSDALIKILGTNKIKEGCITVPYGIKLKNNLCEISEVRRK